MTLAHLIQSIFEIAFIVLVTGCIYHENEIGEFFEKKGWNK